MKKIYFFVICCCLGFSAVAQSSLSITVVDENDKAIPFLPVTVQDTSSNEGRHQERTDIKGKATFSNLNDTGTYLVTTAETEQYYAFVSAPFTLKTAKNNISLVLSDKDVISLQEVVVTALGIGREREQLGYATQKVTSQHITAVPEPNLLTNLAGRVAGVQITQGSSGIGSSSRMVIRGESSFSGTNQPLFVVDGIPVSNDLVTNNTENNERGFQEVDYGNGIAEISPYDIASINVLKGASATALYGSRGINGVVVITTKKAGRQDGIGVSLNSSITFDRVLRLPSYQNTYGQGTAGVFAYEDGYGTGVNDGAIVSYGPPLQGQPIPQFDGVSTDLQGNIVRGGDVIARNGSPITPTPWIARPDNVNNFFETGHTAVNNLALSGASKHGHFRLSYTNLDNQGVIPNTDLKRNSIALHAGYDLHEKLRANAFVNFISSGSTNRPGTGYGSENPMYIFTWMGRQVDVAQLRNYWQQGQEGFKQFNFNYLWMDNPYLTLFENTNGFQKDRLIGHASVSYDFLDNLSVTLRSGTDYYSDLRQSRRAFSSQRFQEGAYREDEVYFKETNTDVLFRYLAIATPAWNVTISAGGNLMRQSLQYKSTLAEKLSVPGVYNVKNSKVPLLASQQNQKKSIHSLYALGQVGFSNSTFLDVSVRNDWSSTLPSDGNAYLYYSASLSTILSDVLTLPTTIDILQARLSTATVGGDTEPQRLKTTFDFKDSYGSVPRVSNSDRLMNENLVPLKMSSFEVGILARFLGNAVGLDITYYDNLTKDQIVELPVSAGSGFTSRFANGGKVRSRGLEAILDITPVSSRHFGWTALFNFSSNTSWVLELPAGVAQYVLGFARVYERSDRSVYFIANPEGGRGRPGRMGDMYGTGLLTVDGRHVYDASGNPVKDPNLRLLGNYNPDFMLGIHNQFHYKNLHLDVLLDWRQGGTLVSRTLAIASTSGVLESTLAGRADNAIIGNGVTNTGTAEAPVYVENTTPIPAQNYYNQFYDRDNEANALLDASYVKLRQLRLAYVFPPSLLQRARLSEGSIFLIGRNLKLWTENPNIDPEVNALQGRQLVYGVEDMSYPSTRSFGLGINLTF